MSYFFWTNFSISEISQQSDPNSNSTIRGYEKRLNQLLDREQTPRVVAEIKKLHKKIKAQKEKIRKQNDKARRSQQSTLKETSKS